MKLFHPSRFFLGFLFSFAVLVGNAFSKEESPLENARPPISAPQGKEAPKEAPKEAAKDANKEAGPVEGSKELKESAVEGGKEQVGADTPKQLPLCKGSYSKVKWTECRGVKREYNGPHFIGQSYDGEFRSGRPHGRGDMRYHDGTRFVGSFEMGVRDGPGVEYAKDGSMIREGFWRAGVLVKTYRTGPAASQANKEEK